MPTEYWFTTFHKSNKQVVIQCCKHYEVLKFQPNSNFAAFALASIYRYWIELNGPKCMSVYPTSMGFLGFFQRMYLSILSFKTINKLKLSFECGIPRPQDVGHLCFGLFLTFLSQTRDRGRTSKSQQTTCYCNFFIQLYSAIAVLATCPRMQGYRKETLFHTKHRSGGDRESNPGHLLGRQCL
jgi:hypothetical protein